MLTPLDSCVSSLRRGPCESSLSFLRRGHANYEANAGAAQKELRHSWGLLPPGGRLYRRRRKRKRGLQKRILPRLRAPRRAASRRARSVQSHPSPHSMGLFMAGDTCTACPSCLRSPRRTLDGTTSNLSNATCLNTASLVFYDTACLIRLLEFATFFAAFEETMR